MRCKHKHCRKKIYKDASGVWRHVESDVTACNLTAQAEPAFKPGQRITGQEWLNAGGSWGDFVEAHKNDTTAKHDITVMCDLKYNGTPRHYILQLGEDAELPKEKREVPLVNPLKIPINWWGIAMSAGKYWNIYLQKPQYEDYLSGPNWAGLNILLKCDIDFQCDWKESRFTRAEIQARWEEEYGEDWVSKAMEDAE